MRFPQPISLKQLAAWLKIEYIGAPDLMIGGLNVMQKVEADELTFTDHEKYEARAIDSLARVVIARRSLDLGHGRGILISPQPFEDFRTLIQKFSWFTPSSAMISPEASIGENTILQPGVFIGHNVSIGDRCILHANVTIQSGTIIGDDVVIHPNTVIGGDAFFYKKTIDPQGQILHDKLTTGGRVVIHNSVEIGSGCTIDRGVTGDTIIGEGTKIDNLVHIAHGVVLGRSCLIAAQCGIAGKATLEDGVVLWGQVGIAKEVVIGKNAVVLAQSGVSKSLEGGKTYFGYPAQEARRAWKEMAWIRQKMNF